MYDFRTNRRLFDELKHFFHLILVMFLINANLLNLEASRARRVFYTVSSKEYHILYTNLVEIKLYVIIYILRDYF